MVIYDRYNDFELGFRLIGRLTKVRIVNHLF
jgi:hypothetical protein